MLEASDISNSGISKYDFVFDAELDGIAPEGEIVGVGDFPGADTDAVWSTETVTLVVAVLQERVKLTDVLLG